MTTDTSERGLEDLIVRAMTGHTDLLSPEHVATETSAPVAGGTGWLLGDPHHYDRDYCVDLVQLQGFVLATQEDLVDSLSLGTDGPTRRDFLARLQGEISKRGTIDVLRHGVKHGPHHVDLFYGTPSPDNAKAVELFARNRFSVTRQLRYSADETQLALDLCLFVNGLPVATFELKNSLTKQTVDDAVRQYQRDRDRRERLFELGRCVAHFAVDDAEVRFCTELKGSLVVVPALQPRLERRRRQPAQPERAQDRLPLAGDPDAARAHRHPRELRAGRQLQGREDGQEAPDADLAPLSPARRRPPPACRRRRERRREALPDPALGGSGKSNSIAWLAHQLIGLEHGGRNVVRLCHRRHRPSHPRRADPRDDQAVRAGERDDRRGHRAAPPSCASSSRAARRSSSRPSRSSRSSSTSSARRTASGTSRS